MSAHLAHCTSLRRAGWTPWVGRRGVHDPGVHDVPRVAALAMPGLQSMPHRHLKKQESNANDAVIHHGKPCHVKLVYRVVGWLRRLPRWRFYALGVIGSFLIIGTIGYSLLEPDWTVLDAFYFSLVTITTVGFGCMSPTSEGSRVFTLLYIAASYAFCLPIAIGLFFTAPIESCFNLVKRVLTCLVPKEWLEEGDPRSPPGPWLFYARGYVMPYFFAWVCCLLTAIIMTVTPQGHFDNSLVAAGDERKLTFIESLYLTCISASTIGYGDICPASQLSRLYMSLLLPVSAGFVMWLVTVVGDLLHTRMQQLRLAALLSKPLDQLLAAELPEGSIDKGVDKADFLVAMLLACQLVPKESLVSFVEQFNRLDGDGSGVLDRADLEGFSWDNHPGIKLPPERKPGRENGNPSASRWSILRQTTLGSATVLRAAVQSVVLENKRASSSDGDGHDRASSSDGDDAQLGFTVVPGSSESSELDGAAAEPPAAAAPGADEGEQDSVFVMRVHQL